MCNKPFDSIICNFAFFLTACAGLIATSGVALRLGGTIMNKHKPENMEYPFYASEPGFFIGVKSAAYFQWLTAGIATLFARINATDTDKHLGGRIVTVCLENVLLLFVFGGFHYFSLPISVQDEINCIDLKEQLMKGKGSSVQNPLCESDHSLRNLFTAFFVGTSICFVGCLLLQMIYLCFRAVCETESTPSIEPVVEAPVLL